jgi:DNA-binding response OmpR family regulator
LLVTGYLVEENIDGDEVKGAGIDMVLEKPFHFKKLVPAIKEILVEWNILK